MIELVGERRVVRVHGDFDGLVASDTLEAVENSTDRVIVDLLAARFVDFDVLDAFVAAVPYATRFVAEQSMLRALHLVGLSRHVDVEETLAAALA
jgi:anti-anti-sigma regulatory factor